MKTKAFGGLFGLNLFLVLIELAIGMPVALWQVVITVMMGLMFFKSMSEAKAREEKIGQIYSSYDPKTYKAPTKYHDM